MRISTPELWPLEGCFGEEFPQVQRPGDHRQAAVRLARPLAFRPVAVELHAILIRVAQVERLADAVVGGPVEGNACLVQAAQRLAQLRAIGKRIAVW